jgi:hypothetical protein
MDLLGDPQVLRSDGDLAAQRRIVARQATEDAARVRPPQTGPARSAV